MKIYLFRHGQTNWNIINRLQGRTDNELNETGIQQAIEASKNYLDIPFDYAFSSPLARTRKTAKLLLADRDLEVHTDERLIEFCFGIFEGKTPEETADNPQRQLLFTRPDLYQPDPTAESLESMIERTGSFLEDLKKLEGKYENVLISGHGCMNRAILINIGKYPLRYFWKSTNMNNCSCVELTLENGQYTLPEYICKNIEELKKADE